MGDELENCKVGLMVNGEFKEINLSSLEAIPNSDTDLEIELAKWENGGFQFAMKHFGGIGSWKALERYGIYRRSNNWNKMHHLPKRRSK